MLLFIIIFFAVVITVGLSAVLGFSFYLKRRTAKRLETENQQYLNPQEYRSLFAPSDEEMRVSEREESERQKAKAEEKERQAKEENLAALADFRNSWRDNPNRKNTVELFRRAAASGSAEAFSETASAVIELWREKRIENLPAPDLADLLDSHLRILPQQERTAGKLFWLREETAELRRASEDNF